jgi:hypothetical protein
MRAHLPRLIGAAAATLFFVTAGSAQAQGKSHDNGHGKGHDNDHAAVLDQRHHDDDHDARRDEHHDQHDPRYDHAQANPHAQTDPRYDHGQYDPRYDDRQYSGRRIPPGLAKKPGGMPPGQYKKLYSANQGAGVLRDVLGRRGYPVVRSTDVGESEYVYYRNHDGSIRRAIVSPGTDRLRFSNVPSTLLSEVLSRLY